MFDGLSTQNTSLFVRLLSVRSNLKFGKFIILRFPPDTCYVWCILCKGPLSYTHTQTSINHKHEMKWKTTKIDERIRVQGWVFAEYLFVYQYVWRECDHLRASMWPKIDNDLFVTKAVTRVLCHNEEFNIVWQIGYDRSIINFKFKKI